MTTVLVTGGSGFFGGVLKHRLLDQGFTIVNLDLVADPDHHERLSSVRGDLRDRALIDRLFAGHRFTAVMHCAAMLAHEKIDQATLWQSNVEGTRNLADACRRHGVKSLVFISTNCLWAHSLGRPVREDDTPAPVESYGRSKLAAEEILEHYRDDLHVVVIRSPTIIDSGRLGLLAILFEFIYEGRRIWVVGDGDNRYQFVYAQDLANACLLAMDSPRSDLFHVGSDEVPTLRQVYQAVIEAAGTGARVARLPKGPTLRALKLAHHLGISPLGPYHYRMIAEDFLFDTSHIRDRLGWRPTLNNQQMMVKAYQYYASRREEIDARAGEVSAHSRPANMGVIRLLKWIS